MSTGTLRLKKLQHTNGTDVATLDSAGAMNISNIRVPAISSSTGNSALTIAADGTFLPQKVPCAFMYRNASGGNASASSWTKIPFDAEEFDVGSIADTSDSRFEFTTATAGIYFFSASIRITQTSILNRFILAIRKNGGTYLGQTEIGVPDITGSLYPQIQADTIVSVADGDYVDAAYYITGGNTSTITESMSATNFYCYRISA